MAENPPLNRLYVLGYAANDRDYPTVSMNLDPRVAGYKVPEDLSTCPDKRYPNHVFTGAQPLSGDERVRHVWEILPSPWVPFTRYDDDLGPIQGRRRSVENTGQQASLASDTKISYEGREGSAIVSTELEETWSIKTDEDGNSLFPIKDRDFYDASRGPVQERRQLFVPTGEEVGSLENVDGVITQTSYEPYNEFLSVKIVQTYRVDGPQLIGKTTDNDGQLVTVTTQRRGALNYTPPNPTSTRTVEVNREDAESLVERIVDTPEIFKANTFSVERPDPIPQKFRVAVPIKSSQEIVEGDAKVPTLEEGEISKSQEQRNKFIKRVSSTSRDQAVLPKTLTGKATNNERQTVTVTETLQLGNTTEIPTATTTIESEALGDGNYVVTKTQVDEVFGAETYRKTKDDLTPQKFKAKQEESTVEENVAGIASGNITLGTGQFVKSEQQINKFVKRVSTTTRNTQNSERLDEKVITPEGQLASRTITLANGIQTLTPSATVVDGNIEELGDGRTVKTEIKIDKVFDSKQKTITQATQIPAKFLNGEITETAEVQEGNVEEPEELGEGGFGIVQSSSQRVSQFVRRQTKKEQDGVTSLTENQTNNFKQKVTVTSSIVDDPEVQPSATTEFVRTQSIGGGKYVKETGTVDNVFDSKSLTVAKPDTIPEKFRVKLPQKRTEEIISQEQVDELNLEENEYTKTEQRLTEFTVQKTTTERESDYESIQSSDLEETWGISIPYEESIVDSFGNEENCEYDGLGDSKYIKRLYDISQLSTKLDGFSAKSPTTINLNLPKILKEVTCTIEKSESVSEERNSIPYTLGLFGNLSFEDAGSFTSTVSFIPRFDIVLEEIWANDIEATLHIFFLKSKQLTVDKISSKCGAEGFWPKLNPSSFSTVVFGKSESKTYAVSVNRFHGVTPDGFIQRENLKTNYNNSAIPVNLSIPNCIVEETITINEQEDYNYSDTIRISFPSISNPSFTIPAAAVEVPFFHNVNFTANTTINGNGEIPRSGKYVINSSAEPYKFGYFVVRAVTFDAAKLERD